MRCDEAREYLSALYDGETVPLQAAEHTVQCARCQETLKAYAETGAALRSYGALLVAAPVPERTWLRRNKNRTTLWERGLQMMRIPRIAFACLLTLLAVLGSRLALIEVRAHEDGTVLRLELTPAQGDSLACDVPVDTGESGHCDGLAQIDGSNLFYSVRAVKREGSRVLLSIRSKVTPMGPASFGPETAGSLPELQSWFTPGETIAVPNTGDLKLLVKGEWSDHLPVGGHALLDPAASEIRLSSPLVLKNGKVAGDLRGASAAGQRPDQAVWLYVPGEGRFVLSAVQMEGAVAATVDLNRITFTSNGQMYMIVTGMPITRSEKLWVRHDTAYQAGPYVIGSGPVGKLL